MGRTASRADPSKCIYAAQRCTAAATDDVDSQLSGSCRKSSSQALLSLAQNCTGSIQEYTYQTWHVTGQQMLVVGLWRDLACCLLQAVSHYEVEHTCPTLQHPVVMGAICSC